MKTPLFLLAALGAAIAALPMAAAPNKADTAAAEAPSADAVTVSRADERGAMIYSTPCPLYFQFSEEMIAPEQVGSDARALISLSPALKYTADWYSTSGIRVVIGEQELPMLQNYLLRVAPATSLRGKHSAAFEYHLTTARTTAVPNIVAPDGQWWRPIWFSCTDDKTEAFFLPKLKDARYAYVKDDKATRTQGITYRPATVADALADWQSYKMVSDDTVNETDREAFAELPPATVLPHVYLIDPPTSLPHQDEALRLRFADAMWGDTDGAEDGAAPRQTAPWDCYLSSNLLSFNVRHERTGLGEYDVFIDFNQPMPATLKPESVAWSIQKDGDLKAEKDALAWENGAWKGTLNGKFICMRALPDEANGAPYITQLRYHISTEGAEVRLYCDSDFESALGGKTDNAAMQKDFRRWNLSTALVPDRPQLITDFSLGALRVNGSRCVHYRYTDLENVRARVIRLSSAGADAVRVLRAYQQQYVPNRYTSADDGNDFSRVRDLKTGKLVKGVPDGGALVVNPADLPGQMGTQELALGNGKADGAIELQKLFPEQEGGNLYFVSVEGQAMPGWKEGGRFANQGLLQVTDLGFTAHCAGTKLTAYAYHLSDGHPAQEGTMIFYSKDAAELGRLSIRDGMSEGTIPEGSAYLCLQADGDSYTTAFDASGCYWPGTIADKGGDPATFPLHKVFLFSDRPIYRNGETAHIKGMVRTLIGNKLSLPKLAKVALKWEIDGEEHTLPAHLDADGGFSADLAIDSRDDVNLHAQVELDGDADGTSADKAIIRRLCEDDEKLLQEWESNLEDSRSAYLSLPVADFRRNAFEVQNTLTHPDADTLRVEVCATNLTGTPVAHGKLDQNVWLFTADPQSAHWEDFCFGREAEDAEERFFHHPAGCGYASAMPELDAEGKATVEFSLAKELRQTSPGRVTAVAESGVTDGNGQLITAHKALTIDSSAVYAGLRLPQSRLQQVGGSVPVDAVLINADGSDYTGAPLKGTLQVKRKSFHPYRYGAKALTGVRNAEEEEELYTTEMPLSGQPGSADVPLPAAGIYTFTLTGRDADGKPFECSCTRYVWGDAESPWPVENMNWVAVCPDRDSYAPGDTAKLLIAAPVEGDVILTRCRDTIRGTAKYHITPDRPIIEVPLTAADAPGFNANVTFIETRSGASADAAPRQLSGEVLLRVEAADKKLGIALDTPKRALVPGETCRMGGTVTDAAGNPVPNAHVTLYAVDEGVLTLDFRGVRYRMPDPSAAFYGKRPDLTKTINPTVGTLAEALNLRDFGNKGVFIGGGDDEDVLAAAMTGEHALNLMANTRENFTPCALWLADVATDAQGHFSADVTNPDTLTRYRLMAVASAGGDLFGTARSDYTVTKPVMLEPAEPLCATAGDSLDVAVTVSMLPDQLPEGCPKEMAWRVSLSGGGVELPEPTREVRLNGKEPVTITMPVRVQSADTATLTWQIQPAEGTACPAYVRDTVKMSFPVVPPTPHLRETVNHTLTDGSTSSPAEWVAEDFRADTPVSFTLSPNPLVGATRSMAYLFTYPYGCLEQTSSTLLPWIYREEFEQNLGIHFPEKGSRSEVINKAVERLLSCRREAGAYSYWPDGGDTSDYTDYALLVLRLAGRPQFDDEKAMAEKLKNDPKHPLMGLLVQAKAGTISADGINEILRKRKVTRAADWWTLAVAGRSFEHPKAAEWAEKARRAEKAEAPKQWEYLCGEPPVAALRSLYAIKTAPNSPETAAAVQHYTDETLASVRRYSTWETGWLCLVLHEYFLRADVSESRAQCNGQPVTAAAPLVLDTVRGDHAPQTVSSGTLYVSALASGYLNNAQEPTTVNRGFAVSRSYEKLMPDGSWKPTGSFRVGDVVRVNISAVCTTKRKWAPMPAVVEDRLPAAFETVNPELEAQKIPGLLREEGGLVQHAEYSKEGVRFFTYGTPSGLIGRYVARVVRSGRVTAPATKAEFMYRPSVYGLSVPQTFEVQPR